ncbi:MAG: mannose-1-phosphate guanylyltransferase [Planctomycetes bacterium]|nr:mannose-1-phosphate guanylyltransferase [Planctomycetota bacterium]
MLHAVVMAGGAGTRFWPQSRVARPKQFLPFGADGRTLLAATVERLLGAAPLERILVVTGAAHAGLARAQLPDLPADNLIVEPAGRDTAPCVGLAATIIARRDPDGVVAVFPADHFIEPAEDFVRAVLFAADVAHQSGGIVTFGVRPAGPATGYGYIHAGKTLDERGGEILREVLGFEEKPDLESARRYVESGEYYWNSGMFVFTARAMLTALAEHVPDIAAHLAAVGRALGTPAEAETLEREFLACRRISLDYAVMEHARDIRAIVSRFRWDDVGAWDALARFQAPDAEGNVAAGERVLHRARGCTVVSEGGLVALVGVENLVVVRTPDATLVVHRDAVQDTKKVVDALKADPRFAKYL